MSSHERRGLGQILLAGGVVVSLAGLVAELARSLLSAPLEWVSLFSLSYEANLPTWYATVLLFSSSSSLAQIARSAGAHRARWWMLSAIFLYMSIDEASEIHEHAGGLVDGTGVLYFSWVVPAAVAVLALGLFYLPFIRALPSPLRGRVILAGALYVGGALGMELPLGWWTEQHGDEGLGYALIDHVEESLELAGASVFLWALRARLAEPGPVRPGAAEQGA